MMDTSSKTYRGMMRFLRDHDALDELLREGVSSVMTQFGEVSAGAVLYEPIVVTKPHQVRIGHGCRIDSFVKIEGGKGVEIGKHVHIASFAHINIGSGETEIGDYAAVASGARIISGSNQASAISMSAAVEPGLQRVETTRTILRRYACVLTNAVVLPGVVLHEGAVLAAGAVATRDIPAWEIWAGIPAKFLARRVLDLSDTPFMLDGSGDIQRKVSL